MTRYRPPEGEEPPLGSFYMGRMQPPEPPPRRQLPKGLVATIVGLAFVGIIWYAYPQGSEKYDVSGIPLIAADTTPYKFKPDDPGGLEVLHQDSTVFNPIERKSDAVETLMPLPEEPMDKTAAIEAAKAKSPIDASAPKLNLDMQMQSVGKGTEKVISKADAAKAEVVKKDVVKKETASTENVTEKKPDIKKNPETVTTKKEAEPKEEDVPKGAPPVDAQPVYVRLGSYRSESGANDDWKKLSGKYPQYLKNLSVRVLKADLGPKGIYYRLEAGKLSDTRAKQVCDAIKVGHIGGCLIVR